jgi:hypothetical protein
MLGEPLARYGLKFVRVPVGLRGLHRFAGLAGVNPCLVDIFGFCWKSILWSREGTYFTLYLLPTLRNSLIPL